MFFSICHKTNIWFLQTEYMDAPLVTVVGTYRISRHYSYHQIFWPHLHLLTLSTIFCFELAFLSIFILKALQQLHDNFIVHASITIRTHNSLHMACTWSKNISTSCYVVSSMWSSYQETCQDQSCLTAHIWPQAGKGTHMADQPRELP